MKEKPPDFSSLLVDFFVTYPYPIIHAVTQHTCINNLPVNQLGIMTIMIVVKVFVLTIQAVLAACR
jgi:hypothetical protein